MVLNTPAESDNGENRSDGGKNISSAPNAHNTGNESEDSGYCEDTVENDLVGHFLGSIVSGILYILERFLTDFAGFGEVDVSFSIVHGDRFTIVAEFGNVKVVTETLCERFDADIAFLGGNGRHTGCNFFQSVFNLLDAVFKLGKRSFTVFQLLSTVSELLLTVGIVSLAFGVVRIALIELDFTSGEFFLTVSELFLTICKVFFALCDLFLALFESNKAVLILFELSFAVGDHVLDVLRQVGYVVWNIQIGLLGDRTNDGGEPFLCIVKSRERFEVAVAELNILVYIRHEGLNLSELLFAFVVSLRVVVDLLLTVGELFLTGCEVFLTLSDLLAAFCELLHTVIIVFLTFDEVFAALYELLTTVSEIFLALLVIFYALIILNCTGEVSVLVGSELANTVIQRVELLDDSSGICLIEVINNGERLFDADTSGNQRESADQSKNDAADLSERLDTCTILLFSHFFLLSLPFSVTRKMSTLVITNKISSKTIYFLDIFYSHITIQL